MAIDRVALLSVRPRFAEALVVGTKTVEIRRRRAHIADGAICLLYASSPVCAVIGAMRVERTDVDTIDRIWSRWGEKSGLFRSEYDAYVAGSTQPCAIIIAAAVRLDESIPLQSLRQRQYDFVAPQSYRFLRAGELASITNGQGRQLDLLAASGADPVPAKSAHLPTRRRIHGLDGGVWCGPQVARSG